MISVCSFVVSVRCGLWILLCRLIVVCVFAFVILVVFVWFAVASGLVVCYLLMAC